MAVPVPPVLRSLAASRVVHFAAMGAVLALVAPREVDDRKIVIDAARAEGALRAEQARSGRPLTPSEKDAALRALIDEEVLAREAARLGIGTDDPVVRARLAERMRASLAAALPPPPVDDGELAAETAKAAERAPERIRLAVWFVAKDRPDAARAAEDLARAIAADGPAAARGRGDRAPLPDGAVWTEESLARVAGPGVARAAFEGEIGKATPPLASAWGFYVLVPLERRRADPSELRAEAHAAITKRKQEAAVERLVERARKDYAVDVVTPAGEPPFDPSARPRPSSEGVD